MDLLEEIKNKSTALAGDPSIDGLNAVIRHIEVAERYLLRARVEREDDLFNDVIYRTNQAFEGILKEAYTVTTGREGSKLSPNQIEQYLLDEQLLATRVLDLFTNYRRQWRNPSTHDHKLFFNDQEALLAIVSVSAFINILLDQIIETINRKLEHAAIEQKKELLQTTLSSSGEMPLHQELIILLELFSEELLKTEPDPMKLTEIELTGRLHGFIESLDSESNVIRLPSISGHPELRPDFLIQKNNQEVILELKRVGSGGNTLANSINQVLNYLTSGKWDQGILFVPPALGEQVFTTTAFWKSGGQEITVHTVAPNQSNFDVVDRLSR